MYSTVRGQILKVAIELKREQAFQESGVIRSKRRLGINCKAILHVSRVDVSDVDAVCLGEFTGDGKV